MKDGPLDILIFCGQLIDTLPSSHSLPRLLNLLLLLHCVPVNPILMFLMFFVCEE